MKTLTGGGTVIPMRWARIQSVKLKANVGGRVG